MNSSTSYRTWIGFNDNSAGGITVYRRTPASAGQETQHRHANDRRHRFFSQDYAGRVGFPNYALTNNSANIRRLEKRLAAIQNTQNDETTEERFTNGVCLVDNVEANRLQIFFPEIPSEEIRRELKRNGFHWSPTVGAWQRHRSNRAMYLAKLILTNHTR